MELITSVIAWFSAHLVDLFGIITSTIGTASIIVKLTPTLKDDNALKAIISFVGKYIAIDKYGPKGEVK